MNPSPEDQLTPERSPANASPETAAPKSSSGWRKLGLSMLIPFFLATIMGLCYLGGFHEPTPTDFRVAVVGDDGESRAFAQALQDESDGALAVRTVPDTAAAQELVAQREVSASFEMGEDQATLFVSSAASETSSGIAQKIFNPIAFDHGLPLHVDDVVPAGAHDTAGQGMFFLLVALSIGGYSCAVPLAGFMGKVGVATRFALATGAAGIVALLGMIIAGPIYQVITGDYVALWLITWLYVTAIVFLGMGLHPIFRHWTTPLLTLLFVAMNFTTSGGIFEPELQPAFFAAFNSFWNGAAWLHAAQTVVYFPGQPIGGDLLQLACWLVPGALLMLITHVWSERRTRLADDQVPIDEVEEVVAA